MFLNNLQIIGRLCNEPEKKFTTTGKEYASIAVAVHSYHQDKAGKVVEETDFFHVQAYGFNGQKALKLNQGSLVYVDGPFRSHKSEDGRFFWNLKAKNLRRLEKLEKTEALDVDSDEIED